MKNVHVDNDFIGLFVVFFLVSLITHDKRNGGRYIFVSIENGGLIWCNGISIGMVRYKWDAI